MAQLSDYFQEVAYKRLSAVEADASVSNQHEFNGVATLKKIFGQQKKTFPMLQMYLSDEHEYPILAKSELTWYDAREGNPDRSAEFRLYYKGTPVTDHLREGDLMVIAKTSDGKIVNLFARQNSLFEEHLKLLFNLGEVAGRIEGHTIEGEDDVLIGVIQNFILDQLGLHEVSERGDAEYLEEMIRLFPEGLPSTRIFSEYARGTLESLGAGPDATLLQWWEQETKLFKIYEKHRFDSEGNKNLDDIDSFIALSLSMQNIRKSRAGSAFENHVEQILVDNHVRYSRTPTTEGKSKPDFVFPGIDEYKDSSFPEARLNMLAAKTTCKDRWRQVLTEAIRIPHKHLLTLEPAISSDQTDEMKVHNLTLVLPKSIHSSYTPAQQVELLSVEEFIELVKTNTK